MIMMVVVVIVAAACGYSFKGGEGRGAVGSACVAGGVCVGECARQILHCFAGLFGRRLEAH